MRSAPVKPLLFGENRKRGSGDRKMTNAGGLERGKKNGDQLSELG